MKTVSYRTVSTVVTAVTVLLVTGDWSTAASVGALDLAVKSGLYVAHELAWRCLWAN